MSDAVDGFLRRFRHRLGGVQSDRKDRTETSESLREQLKALQNKIFTESTDTLDESSSDESWEVLNSEKGSKREGDFVKIDFNGMMLDDKGFLGIPTEQLVTLNTHAEEKSEEHALLQEFNVDPAVFPDTIKAESEINLGEFKVDVGIFPPHDREVKEVEIDASGEEFQLMKFGVAPSNFPPFPDEKHASLVLRKFGVDSSQFPPKEESGNAWQKPYSMHRFNVDPAQFPPPIESKTADSVMKLKFFSVNPRSFPPMIEEVTETDEAPRLQPFKINAKHLPASESDRYNTENLLILNKFAVNPSTFPETQVAEKPRTPMKLRKFTFDPKNFPTEGRPQESKEVDLRFSGKLFRFKVKPSSFPPSPN